MRKLRTSANQYSSFWELLLKRSDRKTKLFSKCSPHVDDWINATSGKPGVSFSYLIRKHWAGVQLYIDKGPAHKKLNITRYKIIYANKDKIEAGIPYKLQWYSPRNTRGRTIKSVVIAEGIESEADWGNIQDAMVNGMISFIKVLKPYVDSLPNK
jgi:hypothetical protein